MVNPTLRADSQYCLVCVVGRNVASYVHDGVHLILCHSTTHSWVCYAVSPARSRTARNTIAISMCVCTNPRSNSTVSRRS
jgi:hypothetical protein